MSPTTPDQPLRALLYCRASADPTGRALSVTAQERENRARCEREGWTIAGVIVDNDRSASRFAKRDREGYEQAKKAIAGHVFGRIDVLVAVESSRAVRDLDAFAELRRLCAENRVLVAYGGRLADMTRGDDRFTAGVDALVDERYAEEARERTLRGHRTSVQNLTPRGFPGYGYRFVRDPHTGRLIGQERDPESSAVVEEIVRRVLAGDTLYSIAKSLDDADVLTPQERLDRWKGRTDVERAGWSSSMLRNLLSKQSLMGVRTHHGQAVGRGTWEPIVSPADWRRVQAILGERRNTGHDTNARYLLSGIARCGPCGAWLRPMTNRGRRTYACAGVVPTAPKGHVSRGRDQLDAHVIDRVLRVLANPGFAAAVTAKRRGAEDRSSGVQQQIADLEAELAGYVESAAARGGVARKAFEQVVDQLSARIENLQQQLAGMVEMPAAVWAFAGPDAETKWSGATEEEKRLLVRSLVTVTVHRSSQPRGSRVFDWRTVDVATRF